MPGYTVMSSLYKTARQALRPSRNPRNYRQVAGTIKYAPEMVLPQASA